MCIAILCASACVCVCACVYVKLITITKLTLHSPIVHVGFMFDLLFWMLNDLNNVKRFEYICLNTFMFMISAIDFHDFLDLPE
jgi:hypothetical protein